MWILEDHVLIGDRGPGLAPSNYPHRLLEPPIAPTKPRVGSGVPTCGALWTACSMSCAPTAGNGICHRLQPSRLGRLCAVTFVHSCARGTGEHAPSPHRRAKWARANEGQENGFRQVALAPASAESCCPAGCGIQFSHDSAQHGLGGRSAGRVAYGRKSSCANLRLRRPPVRQDSLAADSARSSGSVGP